MKKTLTTIGIVAFVSIWIFLSAYPDYTWSDLIIEEKQSEGWIVAITNSNLIDIFHPWSIFKTPTTQIVFVKPDEIVRLDDAHIFTKELWVNYDYSNTREYIFRNVIDCKNDRSTILDDSSSIDQIDLKNLKWHDNLPDTPGERINKFICNLKLE